jgi:hypothetical protein
MSVPGRFSCVNEDRQIVDGPLSADSRIRRVALHHYVIKSLEVGGTAPFACRHTHTY